MSRGLVIMFQTLSFAIFYLKVLVFFSNLLFSRLSFVPFYFQDQLYSQFKKLYENLNVKQKKADKFCLVLCIIIIIIIYFKKNPKE
jgi:hypothetical protein